MWTSRLVRLPTALILSLLLPKATFAALTCYALDGSSLDFSFVPCDPTASVSACCASNKAGGDICMGNGLCLAQQDGYAGFIFANGCTDKTGQSSICPHIGPTQSNNWLNGPSAASVNILQCGFNPATYCWRNAQDTANCCSNKTAVFTTSALGTILAAVSTSTSTSTSATGTGANKVTGTGVMTVTATVTAGADNALSSGNASTAACKDNSAVVGGAVGGVLGTALLLSLGALGCMCLRRGKRPDQSPPGAMEYPGGYSQTEGGSFSQSPPVPSQSPHSPDPYTLATTKYSGTYPTAPTTPAMSRVSAHELASHRTVHEVEG